MGSNTLTLPRPNLSASGALKTALIAILTLMVLTPAAIAIHAGAYDSFIDNGISGFGLWGSFIIHMWTRPSRKEVAATLAIGIALRLVYDLAVGERGYVGYVVIGMGAFLGLASLIVMAVRCLEKPNPRRDICRRSMSVIALLTYLGFCLGFYLPFLRLVLPRKFDYFLYNFDASLGFQPSFLAANLFDRVRPLFWTELMVYNSLGLWFAVVYAAHANARRQYPVNILKMLVANALLGFTLYFVCPAMGPKYAFASFPHSPGSVQSVPVLLSGVPNAMPSLHFGGALLICWFCKPWKWLHRAMALFAALTGLATLGLGEHYVVDLVVAVPYALAILAFSSNVPERRLPLAVSAATVGVWLLALRFVHFPPVIAWTFVVLTLALSLTMQRRLTARLWPSS
jgi:hypothetical protein